MRSPDISKEKFDLMKKLFDNNVSSATIANIIGIARTSVYAYKKWPDWQAYCFHKKAHALAQKEKRETKKQEEETKPVPQLEKAVLLPKEVLAKVANCLTMAVKLLAEYFN